jgi:hypothetical protein
VDTAGCRPTLDDLQRNPARFSLVPCARVHPGSGLDAVQGPRRADALHRRQEQCSGAATDVQNHAARLQVGQVQHPLSQLPLATEREHTHQPVEQKRPVEHHALALVRVTGALLAAESAIGSAPPPGDQRGDEDDAAENCHVGQHERQYGQRGIPPPCAVRIEDQCEASAQYQQHRERARAMVAAGLNRLIRSTALTCVHGRPSI